MPLPLSKLIEIADREIKQREYVYPRRVADGKMSQQKADYELEGMKDIAQALRRWQEHAPMIKRALQLTQFLQEFPEAEAVLSEFPDATMSVRDSQGQLL